VRIAVAEAGAVHTVALAIETAPLTAFFPSIAIVQADRDAMLLAGMRLGPERELLERRRHGPGIVSHAEGKRKPPVSLGEDGRSGFFFPSY